ncbi:MAG: flippase-like domain-containing protein [Deltaproteobacteria bacterium]|nr:flippase-like domain-containing protein [Deltaproteobacteria bacterium]
MSSKRILSLFGLIFSAIIIIYLATQLNRQELINSLRSIRFVYLPLLIVLMVILNILRALRWKHLLKTDTIPATKNLFEAIIVGFTATFVLPLRAGEFVRAFYISKLENVFFIGAFASIVIERIFDVLALLVLFSCTLVGLPNMPTLVVLGAKSMALLATVMIAVIAVAYKKPQFVINTANFCGHWLLPKKLYPLLDKFLNFTHEFLHGLQSIKHFSSLIFVIIYTALIWLLVSAFYWVSLLALGYSAGFFMGIVVTVIVALAIAAPSAPGFIGTYQAGCIIALSTLLGLSETFAITYSVITHILQAIFIIATGFYYLARRGLCLQELVKRQPDLPL